MFACEKKVSVIKTDKLSIVHARKFLHFEWTLEMSDLQKGNSLRSSDFDIGGEKPSWLELIWETIGSLWLYFHNPKCMENSIFTSIIFDKKNSPFYTVIKTTALCTIAEYIDLLPNPWTKLTPGQYPIKIFSTIIANDLYEEGLIGESNSSLPQVVKKLCSDFKNILEQEANTDIVLEVDGESIKAHKLVLEARSPVFRKMFAHDSSEASQNKIEISDIAPASIKRLLKFLYTAEMEECTSDELLELYYTADKYEVLSLRDCCKMELLKCIDQENACALFSLANRHNDEDLKNAVVKFVSANFKSVVNGNKFLEMDKEEMALLVRLSSRSFKY